MSPVVHSMSLTPPSPVPSTADEFHLLPSSGELPGGESYLIVRVGEERFGLLLESVAEGLDAPVVIDVAGLDGRSSRYVEWRGRRLPLVGARVPFGVDGEIPCAVALILQDAMQPLAVAIDELCEVRELSLSTLRPFAGRTDEHRLVRSVALEGQDIIAILNPAALRALLLAEATAAGPIPAFAAGLAEEVT